MNPFQRVLEFIARDQVDPAMLAQVDYLRAENRILKKMSMGHRMNDSDRIELASLGYTLKKINQQLLEINVTIVTP